MNKWLETLEFIDMYKIFNDEKIAVKGAYTFGLKSIGNALYNLGYIQSNWPKSNIADGFNALLVASLYYKNNDKNKNKTIGEIVNYNEIDCKIIWEIDEFLRK